ncbi:MAG: DUF6438 domain-containing protein [Flavobacteriales bacterium]|nr:DUF6438 domain-containing protein [Flavobacteriales bacterium]
MNRNLIFILFIFFNAATAMSTTSCKNKKVVTEAESAAGATPNEVNTAEAVSGTADPLDGETAMAETDSAEEPKANGDSLIMAFSKTPCYGQCPVYEVKVYESGRAIWEGKNFVERMGTYSTRITASERQKFFAEAEAEGFYDFDKSYDNPMVQDLPSTSLLLKVDGERHRVTIRMGVPKNVKDYFEGAQEWFENRDWQPYESK